MAYDFSAVSPEELAEIKAGLAALEKPKAESVQGSDNQGIVQALSIMAQHLDALTERVANLDKRFTAHHKFFNDEFIGGLQRLYDGNRRSQGVEALRTKYAPSFEPHMAYLKATLPAGSDLFESLHDHLKDRWDDEDFDPDDAIDDLLDELEDRIDAMKNALAAKTEERKEDEDDEEDSDEEPEDFSEEISRLRKMPGMREANAG